MGALLQVGAHYIKDLLDMFVMEPAQDFLTDAVVDATGTEEYVNQAGNMTNQAVGYAHMGSRMQQQFHNLK